MNKRKIWQKTKRLLSLVLALAIAVNGWAGYDLSVKAAEENLTVTLDEFSKDADTEEYSMEYSGNAIATRSIKVSVKDETDFDVEDAEIIWTKDNAGVEQILDAGTYVCTATDSEGNTGKAVLVVSQKTLDIVWGSNTSMEYNGSIQVPDVTVGAWNVTTASADLPVILTTTMQDKNQGSYEAQITLTDNKNYVLSGNTVCKYTVEPLKLDVDWGSLEFTYNGTAQLPVIKVGEAVVNDTKAVSVGLTGDDCSVKMTVPDMKNTGDSYEVTLGLEGMDRDNYTLSETSKVYSVNAKSLESRDITVEGLAEEYSYINAAIEPADIKVYDEDTKKVLTKDTDYTLSYENNVALGDSAKVIITGQGNYSGRLEKTFKIVNNAATAEVNAVLRGTRLDGAAENWFSENDVTLSAPEEWLISESINGPWGESITLTASDETEQTAVYYLKKNSSNPAEAYISAEKTVTYYVDTTAQSISALEVSDVDEWKTSKTVSLKVDGNNIKEAYYTYTIDESATKKGITLIENEAEIEIEDQLDETGVLYTFTVVDNAGHVAESQITITKIDAAAPDLKVKVYAVNGEDVKDFHTNTIKEFFITCEDLESGIDESSLTVTKKVGNDEEKSVEVIDGKFSMDENDADQEIIYRVNVRDISGRPAQEVSFTVTYDVTGPDIENGGLYKGQTLFANETEDEYKVKWINQNDGALYWKVTFKDNFGISKVEVYRGEELVSDAMDKEGSYKFEITDKEYSGLYRIVVTDLAGNVNTKNQYVKVDRVPAVINETSIEGTNNGDAENTWYNASEVSLSAEITANCAPVSRVYVEAKDEEGNVIDTFDLVQETDAYRALISDSDFKYRTYEFYASDEAENTVRANEMQMLRRDSQVPDAQETLVSFKADAQGASISLPDGTVSKFVSYVKHIFVKECVEVTIYVPDTDVDGVYSEVKEIKLEYDNLPYTLTCEAGTHAYIQGEDQSSEKAYNIFSVVLPEKAGNSDINSKIVITSMTDNAGNACAVDENGIVVKSDAMIVVDDVAPVLNKADYSKERNVLRADNKTYHFYQLADDAEVQFEIEETHFGLAAQDGTAAVPEYTVNPEVADENKPVWSFAEKTASGKAGFAGESGKETEYTFTLNYKDPSGNLMIGKDENTENICDKNGVFVSEIIVVDDIAPVLTQFEVVSNGGKLLLDNGVYYAENLAEKEDVQLLLTIEDNDTYFNEEAVLVEYSLDGTNWNELELNEGETWTTGTHSHSAVYCFDGTEDGEDTYQFRVTYRDRAENAMVLPENDQPSLNETEGGTYTSSQKVVIDHCVPELTQMVFTAPIQMYDDETTKENGNVVATIKDAKTKLYYDAAAFTNIEFTITDKYLKENAVAVTVYMRAHKAAEWETLENNIAVERMKIEDGMTYSFTIPSEAAEYYFTVSYTDRAGNLLTYASEVVCTDIKEAYDGGIEEDKDTYISPVIVKDASEPSYTIEYNPDPEAYNSIDSVKTKLTLTEMNLDMADTIVRVVSTDINGNTIEATGLEGFTYNEEAKAYIATWAELLGSAAAVPDYKTAADVQILTLNLSTEANYTVTVDVVDKAKRTAEYSKSYCIDRTAPTITVVTTDGESFTDEVKVQCGLLDFEKSDVTYSVINDGAFARIINKLTFGYFAQAKLVIHVKVHDEIGGVASLVPTCISEGKEVNYVLSEHKAIEADLSVAQYDIELPIDFKGTVQMYGIDHAENIAKDTGAIGMIAETAQKHVSLASNKIEVLTPYSKTPNYYAGNVDIRFTSVDGYSGFYEVNYLAGDLNETVSYVEGEEICTEVVRNHKILASNNNSNNIEFGLGFVDNAAYNASVAADELPIVHIDTTAPDIKVVYDNMDVENEKYYKEERTATITITERNFDPNDTDLDISGPSADISGWHHVAGSGCKAGNDSENTYHTDSCKWVATVRFSQDGDYSFTCSTTDLAGNKGSYGQVDEFVIDKTFPEISVTYDNHKVLNEYYYNAPRTAAIEITEHNFNSSDVVITMTAQTDGSVLSVPSVSGWLDIGDVHRATIQFDYDAEFTFDIAYADLAGNEAEDYVQDEFIIDLTVPEIEIFDIEDMSANNDIVAPGIRYSDTNYDADGTVVVMSGYSNGVVEMTGATTITANGVEFKLDDFERVPEMDDMYTMNATVYDLAGNSTEASVMFSVNRFGSVYTFDEATEALVGENGKYYTNKEQNLVVTETNVDTLEFKEITCNLNGKLTTFVEGKDFTVEESGNEATWKQYTYHIHESNFEEEGTYILTIYSEDRATNASDNNSKGKKIEFAIDKTTPSILISGVADNEQYRENSREVTIDVEDNIRLAEVKVTIDDTETVYSAAEVQEANGKLTMTVGSANHWQSMKVQVFDAAGNETESQEIRFLITSNILVQFFMNKPLFFGTIVLLAGAGGAWWFIIAKKKKENEKESTAVQ